MKISRILIAAILVSAGMLQAQDTQKNLIRNPRFETTKSQIASVPDGKLPHPWYVYGGIKNLPEGCGVSTTEKPAGYQGNSYVVTGSCLLTQSTLAVTPGKTYRVSCMMKTKNMPWKAQARLQIIWLDKGWRELIKEWVDKSGKKQKMWDHQWVWTNGNTDWKEFAIPAITAPANAKYAKIRIGFGSKEAGTAYYADLKMEECAATDPFLNRVASI
ncbi:MAG: carbohydrate binding domain-containing protein, partial [Lentisphaeria bacterium]|nr:carbohydrate binding domain-containing protein [Lentisphaeria bacterium]